MHGGGSTAEAARSGTDHAPLREPLGHVVEPLPPTRLRSRPITRTPYCYRLCVRVRIPV